MNSLTTQVSPRTRGILWFCAEDLDPRSSAYQGVDYLLDGLLTTSMAMEDWTSKLIVGESFSFPLYVFVARTLRESEFTSFLKLVAPLMESENDLLVSRKWIPKDLVPKFRLLK
jgi:hypothetical protein